MSNIRHHSPDEAHASQSISIPRALPPQKREKFSINLIRHPIQNTPEPHTRAHTGSEKTQQIHAHRERMTQQGHKRTQERMIQQGHTKAHKEPVPRPGAYPRMHTWGKDLSRTTHTRNE